MDERSRHDVLVRVYACDPTEHPGAKQKDMITILWCPVK